MKREDFATFVEGTIEAVIRLAEEKSGVQLQRKIAFRWLGPSHPILTEDIVDRIVDRVFVDEEHIYPCVDIGVGDILGNGSLLIVGSVSGYAPRPFGTNWTGRDGPFVHIVVTAFMDKIAGKRMQNSSDQTFAYYIPEMRKPR
jgi:hypothetical protein